jgi:membrane-bound lytic murein transglycosylase D
MARLVKDPARYGLEFSEIPNEPYFQRVDTGGQIDMAVAAQLAGLSTAELYELNPAFHRFATPPSGPNFLLLPVESADTFRENLLQLTPDQRMRVERYAVRPKDTLASIAKQFGTTVNLLRELNGLDANAKLDADAELRIPSAVTSLPPKVLLAAARVDGVHESLRKGQSRHLHVAAQAAGPKAPKAAKAGGQSYVVRAGDTLYSIARTLQVPIESLRSWNKIGSDNAIHPGQKLVTLPHGGG